MRKRVEEIEEEIAGLRWDLDSDLDDFESRLRRATDWKYQFRRHPLGGMGVGFAAGLIIGLGGLGNAFKVARAAAPLVLAYLLKREKDEHAPPRVLKAPPYDAL